MMGASRINRRLNCASEILLGPGNLIFFTRRQMVLFPLTFLWLIQLKEFHYDVSNTTEKIDYSQCIYYFDYQCRTGNFCTRQENNVLFSSWRGVDVPWNVFYGFNGTISAAYLPLADQGKAVGKVLGPFDPNSYWPREPECQETMRGVQIPVEFGGHFRDNTANSTLYECQLAGISNVQMYVDGATGSQVLRLAFTKAAPMWNPQIWDIMSQQEFPDPFPEKFMAPPAWILQKK